ncbi:MAG: hypothetical protein RLZZ519_3183 [Bacteroidota bacterium]|jgi:hypothetical protein
MVRYLLFLLTDAKNSCSAAIFLKKVRVFMAHFGLN